MVESEADELSEEHMLGAVLFGHEAQQVVIDNINQFAQKVKDAHGVAKQDFTPAPIDDELQNLLTNLFAQEISDAYTISQKQARYEALDAIKVRALALGGEDDSKLAQIGELFETLKYRTVRDNILSGKSRIDGRNLDTVRALDIGVGVLPYTHGSALFTRGETQALVTATLGSSRDVNLVDTLAGTKQDHFMLHYNFPPTRWAKQGVRAVLNAVRLDMGAWHGVACKQCYLAPTNSPTPFV